MSTNSTELGMVFWDLPRSLSTPSRGSGTATMPTLGSIVQNGKLAACALPFSTCPTQHNNHPRAQGTSPG